MPWLVNSIVSIVTIIFPTPVVILACSGDPARWPLHAHWWHAFGVCHGRGGGGVGSGWWLGAHIVEWMLTREPTECGRLRASSLGSPTGTSLSAPSWSRRTRCATLEDGVVESQMASSRVQGASDLVSVVLHNAGPALHG